jgi:hypothetical protein
MLGGQFGSVQGQGTLFSFRSPHSHPCSGELSPCRINNGGCQDLCLLTHQGHVNCSCRGGRILQEDFTCRGEEASWSWDRGCCGVSAQETLIPDSSPGYKAGLRLGRNS